MRRMYHTTRKRPLTTLAAAALLSIASIADPATAQQSARPLLPNGASSLQETYQDWQVSCQVIDNAKRCALSQQQVQQNGQRVLAVELQQTRDGKLNGSLILPFGLLLDQGVTLAIDDKSPGQPLRFRTCLPGGCLVPLSLEPAMLTNLRAGATLKIQATSADGPAIPLALSLKGFAAAADRLKALSAP